MSLKSVVVCLIALLLTACTSHQVPKFSCSDAVMLGSDTQSSSPQNNSFSINDPQIVAQVRCNNLTGTHTLRWEWYANGLLYLLTKDIPLSTPENTFRQTVTALHTLSLKGEKAADLPGEWSVRVYRDATLLGEKKFSLVTPATSAPVVKGSMRLVQIVNEKTPSVESKQWVGLVVATSAANSKNSIVLTDTTNNTAEFVNDVNELLAVPAPGFRFVSWTGTGGFAATTANPLPVAGVLPIQLLSANFVRITADDNAASAQMKRQPDLKSVLRALQVAGEDRNPKSDVDVRTLLQKLIDGK